MKRKTNSDPCRIYSYGCLPPTAGADLLREQLAAAAGYYNARVDIEMQRRKTIDDARAIAVPSYGERLARIEALTVAIDEGFAAMRERRSGRGEQDEAVHATLEKLKAERSALWREQKNDRLAADKEAIVEAAKEAAKQAAKEADLEAYRTSGLYWGTRGLVNDAIIAAAKNIHMSHKWDRREGRVGIQLQARGGAFLSWDDICAGRSSMVQLDMRDERYGTVRVRAGSGEGREPAWVELPIKIHRPPPGDTIAKWVWIMVRRQGLRFRYDVQFSFQSPNFACDNGARADAAEACGIDVGWREKPDGSLRVAVLVGSDGHTEELRLPPSLIDSVAFAESVVSASDRLLNEEIEVFASTKSLWTPEQEKLWRMHRQWRSWRRLARAAGDLEREHAQYDARELWAAWKRDRLSAGLDLFVPLAEFEVLAPAYRLEGVQVVLAHLSLWRQKARHLYQMSCDVRAKALRRRQDIYRVWTRTVVERYRRVAVEQLDLTSLVRTQDREPVMARSVRANRVLAACYSLLTLVTQRGGERAKKREAAYTTITCTACGGIGEPTPDMVWTCPHCGASADQDMAAAANLLTSIGVKAPVVASASAEPPSPTPLAVDKRRKSGKLPGGESRRARRRERSIRRAS